MKKIVGTFAFSILASLVASGQAQADQFPATSVCRPGVASNFEYLPEMILAISSATTQVICPLKPFNCATSGGCTYSATVLGSDPNTATGGTNDFRCTLGVQGNNGVSRHEGTEEVLTGSGYVTLTATAYAYQGWAGWVVLECRLSTPFSAGNNSGIVWVTTNNF